MYIKCVNCFYFRGNNDKNIKGRYIAMIKKCLLCKREIKKDNWQKINEKYPEIIEAMDRGNEILLNEREKLLAKNNIHLECY